MTGRRVLARHEVMHPDGRQFLLYGDVDEGTLAAIAAQPADSGHDVSLLHRRYDRLTGSWILVSPARNVRPSTTTTGAGAPPCPLCPGGPELPGPFGLAVFENRYPSMSPHAPEPFTPGHGPDPADVDPDLVRSSLGRCLVVVYTAEHVEHLADLSLQQFANVVAVWREQTAALWAEGHDYVMAFENHGSDVGATLPHLHGQLYAYGHLPPVTATKLASHEDHRRAHGACLGCAVIAEDLDSERVIHANEHFVAAVPFASRWPLEVHVRARHHGVGRLGDLGDDAALDLARAISDVIRRYDRLWGFPLPYMMYVQEAPPARHGAGSDDWHLHVELLPPNRTAHRLKVRASVETALGTFILDTLPEQIAAELRAVDVDDVDWSGVTVPAVGK
ncbi:MAG TPA: galactose-1-phosphate uridylyltransferase [Desertimonas sp.]|nr:galactose-1-phosphate uridylyltransferase [Desertimonas sp.]